MSTWLGTTNQVKKGFIVKLSYYTIKYLIIIISNRVPRSAHVSVTFPNVNLFMLPKQS